MLIKVTSLSPAKGKDRLTLRRACNMLSANGHTVVLSILDEDIVFDAYKPIEHPRELETVNGQEI